MQDTTVRRSILTLTVVAGLASASIAGDVVLQSHRDRPDPMRKEHPEPKITTPPGVLQFVIPGGTAHRGGEVFHFTGAEAFTKPAPGSGTVSPNALTVALKRGNLTLAIALDSKAKDSLHFDLLRLDFTGKGDFREAYVVERVALGADRRTRELTYHFAAWPLEVTLGARKVPIRLWCDYGERQVAGSGQPARSMELGVVLCAQGKCRFGKKVHMVRLHDGDGNLRMNDPVPPSLPVLRGDEITIDPRLAKGKVTCAAYGYYGHPIVVDGRLWNLTVSDDSTKFAAVPYDGPTGSIRIDQDSWWGHFIGERLLFHLRAGHQAVPVPVGRYRLREYGQHIVTKRWKARHLLVLREQSLSGRHAVVARVAAGKTDEIAIGCPLKGTIRPVRNGNVVEFHMTFTDVAGRPDPIMYQSPWVTFSIFDAAGRKLTSFSGRLSRRLGRHLGRWKVPADLRGTFSVSVEFAKSTYPVETPKAVFTIE